MRGASKAVGARAVRWIAMKLPLVVAGVLALFAGVWSLLGESPQRGAAVARTGTSAEAGASFVGTDAGPAAASLREAAGLGGEAERDALTADAAAELAGAEAADATVAILARAVTADGAPIGGAWMELRGSPASRAHGDALGWIRLELAAPEFTRLASQGRFPALWVEVGAAGQATARVSRQVHPTGLEHELGDVVLRPGAALFGRVVDGGGLGMEGAQVVIGTPVHVDAALHQPFTGPPELRGVAQDLSHATTTEPGGAFRLSGLTPGHATVWARTATSLWAFTAEPIGLRAGEEAGEVVLVVQDATRLTLRGTLVDPGGEPVPGVYVLSNEPRAEEAWSAATTDAQGRFHFVFPDEEPRGLRASSPSWEWDDLHVEGVLPGTQDLVVAFEPSEWLWVVVRDGAGRPLPNGRVVGVRAEGPADRILPRGQSTLGTDGRGRLRRPAERFRVRAEAPGYRNALLGPFHPEAFPDPLVITLERAPAFVGLLRRADGAPADNARVALHMGPTGNSPFLTHVGWGGAGTPFVHALNLQPLSEVRTDADGRFHLPLPGVDVRAEGELVGLDPREQQRARAPAGPSGWYVRAALAGHATRTHGPVVFEGESDVELELALPEAGALEGRLVLEDGAAAQGGAVSGGTPHGWTVRGWTVRATDGLADLREVQVGADGAFRFDALHPGGWQLRAFAPDAWYFQYAGQPTDAAPVPDVHVVAGCTVTHELRVAGRRTATLAGRLWIDGAPPGAWRVRVRTLISGSGSLQRAERILDPDGRFEATVEPDARVALDLRSPDGALRLTAELPVGTGENAWSLDLETATLTGVIDPAAVPAEYGPPWAYEADLGVARARVPLQMDAAGRYGPVTVPAGLGRLLEPLPDGPPRVAAEFQLQPGEVRALDLR